MVVGYYLPEVSSETIERALGRLQSAAVSALVEIEFASVIARKIRTGDLGASAGRAVLELFHEHRADGLYRMLSLSDSHYVQARRWIEALKVPLRTMDAIHLAIANEESLPLLTADRQLAASAKTLGVRSRLISP